MIKVAPSHRPAIGHFVRLQRACAPAALAALLGIALGVPMAGAQEKKAAPAAKGAAPAQQQAAPAAAQPQGEEILWVKLCEKAPVIAKDKDGKEVQAEKQICLTHHERLDGNTGMVVVSAAIRQVEGQDKQHLMVMVPLGMALAPGLRASVYAKDLWDKANKGEKIDESKIKPLKLNFSLCHPAGCTAEIDLTPEIIEQLRTGGGMMVLAINGNGQVLPFPVPLSGFAKALDGQPADNTEYLKQRRIVMGELEKRRAAMIEEMKQKQQQGGQQQPSAAPATKAPAEKKK